VTDVIALAFLMLLVTYPSRAVPILAPGIERLPAPALEYLRLVAPAVLAAIGAVNVLAVKPGGEAGFHLGVEVVAVIVCLVLTRWRKNLLLGLVAAVVLVSVSRAAGLG
jgi:branched-subunit amino acid transport protein